MSVIFVGIDYSITSPAMCIQTPDKMVFLCLNGRKKFFGKYDLREDISLEILPTPDNHKSDIERYARISKPFLDCILEHSSPADQVIVAIEGYSFGSTGSAIFNIAENCQTLKIRLFNEPRVTIVDPAPAPTSIKKFATGKGNAKKEDMGNSFLTLTQIDVSSIIGGPWSASPVADVVDAFWICKYAQNSHSNTNAQ